jgi:MHS family alpha-ketoglutarate permease-like MFS transporter
MDASIADRSTINAAPTGMMSWQKRLRSICAGSIGNLVEWYDWYAYTAFSLYFARVFFPSGSQTSQLLNTAAVFAVGFLMRPIGGWLLGRVADRHGRKNALLVSIGLMSVGSLAIGLSPGYESIGTAAPVILVLARLLQGLSVGGEYGTSATYLSEMAPAESRGLWSSLQYVTLVSGQLAALGLLVVLQQFVLTSEQLHDWGWRIPFLLGTVLSVVAVYIRRSMVETDVFRSQQTVRRQSSLRELARYPRQIATVVGLTLGGCVAFNTYTNYMQKYLVNSVGMDKADATSISAASLLLFAMLQPLVGALSDRIGRRPVLIAFGVAGTVATYPILSALREAQSWWGAFALVMAALVIVSGYTAINAVVKAELFPTSIRAMGVGLPYALTLSVFGGTAEYIALWFRSIGQEEGYYWYVTACIAVSLCVYVWMPDTRNRSLG